MIIQAFLLLNLACLIIAAVFILRRFSLGQQHTLQANLSLQKSLDMFHVRLEERDRSQTELRDTVLRLLAEQREEQHQQRARFDEHQIKSLQLIQENLQSGMTQTRLQVTEALNNYAQLLAKQMEKLTTDTDLRLKEISGQVEKRLTEGFEKTTSTFTDVIKRLALIDEAQKKITELSSNVVSLQEILSDKRSRGAFGEVQLNALLSNMVPANHYVLQHTLSNGKRVDCMLFLPEPTGNIGIDAKFPLETYRRLNENPSPKEKLTLETQFRQDIRKHIDDIANKYIVPGETTDGAMMFIPAEAIFAEIHAHYSELVDYAQHKRVWMASPTTMMAILTTARAVLKDAATRQQVHVIQEHLTLLGKDFTRFQERMDALARHIRQAHEDAEQVQTSSRKITRRFNKIESVELTSELTSLPPILQSEVDGQEE